MKLWQFLMDFAEAFGRARAAASLSRIGKYEEARKLILQDSGGKRS